jgi:FMN phosphatase YigB (HAD superfamily)
MLKDKVILVDCDGVLLDWEYAFDRWMDRHGYVIHDPTNYLMSVKYQLEHVESRKLIRMFNESASIRKIPPLRDAMKYVRKLHTDHGYIFHCITSQTDDEYAQHLRKKNLQELFGPSTFETFEILPCGADKDGALQKYKFSECWWVEDKPENANVGAQLGLKSLLMHHVHNQNEDGKYTRVCNWAEIYDIIVNEDQRG